MPREFVRSVLIGAQNVARKTANSAVINTVRLFVVDSVQSELVALVALVVLQ